MQLFKDKKYLLSAGLGIFYLLASIIINFYAVQYATISASGPVTDIVLSNTRVYDVDGFFIYGSLLMVLFVAILCLARPKNLPFVVKTIAFFVLTRSIFIMLTHIGPFPTQAIIDPSTQNIVTDIFGKDLFLSFFSGNDFFFSGHTGLPFLMALVYWKNQYLRGIFLILSVAFAVTVLLAHLHYSIDVLAAFYITFCIYRMSRTIFAPDLTESLK